MADKIYVGDEGTIILIDMGEDISAATVSNINVRKGSGDVTWTATVYNSNYLRYVIQAGDFDEAGTYYLQPYLEFTDWKGKGKTVNFEVYEAFK